MVSQYNRCKTFTSFPAKTIDYSMYQVHCNLIYYSTDIVQGLIPSQSGMKLHMQQPRGEF